MRQVDKTGRQRSWCGAACTAMITNYKAGTRYDAEDVVVKINGSANDTAIPESSLSAFMVWDNLQPAYGFALSSTIAQSHIDNNRPVLMTMHRAEADHALVLNGYNTSYYQVINPQKANSDVATGYMAIQKYDYGPSVSLIHFFPQETRIYYWSSSIAVDNRYYDAK